MDDNNCDISFSYSLMKITYSAFISHKVSRKVMTAMTVQCRNQSNGRVFDVNGELDLLPLSKPESVMDVFSYFFCADGCGFIRVKIGRNRNYEIK